VPTISLVGTVSTVQVDFVGTVSTVQVDFVGTVSTVQVDFVGTVSTVQKRKAKKAKLTLCRYKLFVDS